MNSFLCSLLVLDVSPLSSLCKVTVSKHPFLFFRMQALPTCKNSEQLSFLTCLFDLIPVSCKISCGWSEPTSKGVTDWQVNLLCHCFSQRRSTNSMHCQIRCSRTNYENKWDVPLVFMEEDSLPSTWGGILLFCQENKVSGCVCMFGSVCTCTCLPLLFKYVRTV